MSMAALHKLMQRRAGPLTSTGLTQVTAFLATKYAERGVPDVQIFFDGFHAGCQSELTPALRCAPPNATHSRGDYYDVNVSAHASGLGPRGAGLAVPGSSWAFNSI